MVEKGGNRQLTWLTLFPCEQFWKSYLDLVAEELSTANIYLLKGLTFGMEPCSNLGFSCFKLTFLIQVNLLMLFSSF